VHKIFESFKPCKPKLSSVLLNKNGFKTYPHKLIATYWSPTRVKQADSSLSTGDWHYWAQRIVHSHCSHIHDIIILVTHENYLPNLKQWPAPTAVLHARSCSSYSSIWIYVLWFIHEAVRSSYYEASSGRTTDEKLTRKDVAGRGCALIQCACSELKWGEWGCYEYGTAGLWAQI